VSIEAGMKVVEAKGGEGAFATDRSNEVRRDSLDNAHPHAR
jgi:hypothetical protein